MAAGPNLWTFCALLLGGLTKEEKGVVCNDREAVRRERSPLACVPRPLPGADAKLCVRRTWRCAAWPGEVCLYNLQGVPVLLTRLLSPS